MPPISQNSATADWSLVVPSCDAYNDTWPYFFHFLFLYWPDVPTPVYLISNTSTYVDDRVKTILVGEDQQWATNLDNGLKQIPAERLIMLLDDFLLNQPVQHALIQETWEQFNRLNAKYLAADNFGKEGEREPGTRFCRVTPEKLVVGLNATFWRKTHLQEVAAEHGLNIWKTENRVKALAKADPRGHYFLAPDAPDLLTYEESIKGYFWKTSSIEFLAKHNLRPNLWRRPCPPQGEDPMSRFLRSLHKRRMRFANQLNGWLGGALREKVIRPLKP